MRHMMGHSEINILTTHFEPYIDATVDKSPPLSLDLAEICNRNISELIDSARIGRDVTTAFIGLSTTEACLTGFALYLVDGHLLPWHRMRVLPHPLDIQSDHICGHPRDQVLIPPTADPKYIYEMGLIDVNELTTPQ